tara:strand:- start:152 stop:319 length:168 start_codon:yes stop_codon:yes gene_type:complete
MNETDYSIEEILVAINEINGNSKFNKSAKNTTLKLKSEIPISTLKIIEEAEKSQN